MLFELLIKQYDHGHHEDLFIYLFIFIGKVKMFNDIMTCFTQQSNTKGMRCHFRIVTLCT